MSAGLVTLHPSNEQQAKGSVSLGWYARVEQVAKMAGVPIFEDLLCRKSTSVRVEGKPGALKELDSDHGFVSLHSFVESVSLPGGYVYSWENWELDARAAAIAKAFAISTDFHPREVTDFYTDVCDHLERRPADAQEFWHTHHLLTQNRSDARLAKSEHQVKVLSEQAQQADASYTDALKTIEQLSSELNEQAWILGDLPKNFTERFSDVASLTALYDAERARSSQLADELSLAQSDLAITEGLVKELKAEIEQLKEYGAVERAGELKRALEEAEQAKRFLAKVQDRKSQSAQTIADQEKALANLRKLNERMTALAAERGEHVKRLERAESLGKRMNRKLTKALQLRTAEVKQAHSRLAQKDLEKAKLLAKLLSARRWRIACQLAIVVIGSFSAVLCVHLLGW